MSGETDFGAFQPFSAVCPLCATAFDARQWRIIDADRRPDLVVHAIDGSLHRAFCPQCIGPGVEALASFCIVRRVGEKVQRLTLVRGEPEALAAEDAALQEQLLQRVGANQLEWVGTRWIEARTDVDDAIADTWPDLAASVDPVMLAGPLLALLNAGSAAQQASALRAATDLARPNIELFLTKIGGAEDEQKGMRALRARSFIAAARSLGLDEAVRRAEAEEAERLRFAALPEAMHPRLAAFMENRFPTTAAAELYRAAAALAGDLSSAGFPGATEVWAHAGMLLRARTQVHDAMPWAARAYEEALCATAPERAEQLCTILTGLATVWNLRRDGDRSENVERALEYAVRARVAAAALPIDHQVDAAIEEGNLYLHRPTGDPNSNFTLARESFAFARDIALSADDRVLAKYNLALVDVEDRHEDALGRGIAQLQALATPEICETLFDAEQQQHLFQSLGVALAKRAPSEKSQPDDLDQAAVFIERALALAHAREMAHDAAFLASILASVQADRRRPLEEILPLLDAAASIMTPEKAPTDYARNELRRARILQELGNPELVIEMVAQAYAEACRFLTPTSAPDLCRRAQSQLGEIRFRQKDFVAAAQAFSTACAATENVYAWSESVAERTEEVALNSRLYEGLIDSQSRVASDSAADAWRILEAMEAGRARLTLDLMGLRPLPAFPGIPEELLREEAQLIARLAWTIPGAATDLAPIDAERLRQQRATQAELRNLWAKIAACGEAGTRYARLRQGRPPKQSELAALAEKLGHTAAIVSFFILQDRILAVSLRAGESPRLHPIPVPRRELREDWIANFQRDVLEPTSDTVPTHDWLALGEFLFAPFADELEKLELLVVVPHGDLHMLPLHALTVNGQPLIEQVPVVYGPSLGVLASIYGADRGDQIGDEALVASHAVTAAEAAEFEGEADRVAQRFHTRARHHVQRETVINAAPRSSLIHLACHGYFNATDPLESGRYPGGWRPPRARLAGPRAPQRPDHAERLRDWPATNPNRRRTQWPRADASSGRRLRGPAYALARLLRCGRGMDGALLL